MPIQDVKNPLFQSCKINIVNMCACLIIINCYKGFIINLLASHRIVLYGAESRGFRTPVSTLFLKCKHEFKTLILLEFDVFTCLNILKPYAWFGLIL